LPNLKDVLHAMKHINPSNDSLFNRLRQARHRYGGSLPPDHPTFIEKLLCISPYLLTSKDHSELKNA